MGQDHSKPNCYGGGSNKNSHCQADAGSIPRAIEDATERLLMGCGNKRPLPEVNEGEVDNCAWHKRHPGGSSSSKKAPSSEFSMSPRVRGGSTPIQAHSSRDEAPVAKTEWFVRPGSSPQRKKMKQEREQEIRRGNAKMMVHHQHQNPRADSTEAASAEDGPLNVSPTNITSWKAALQREVQRQQRQQRQQGQGQGQQGNEARSSSGLHAGHVPAAEAPTRPPRPSASQPSVLDKYMGSLTPQSNDASKMTPRDSSSSSINAPRHNDLFSSSLHTSRSSNSGMTPGQSANPFMPRSPLLYRSGSSSSPPSDSPLVHFASPGAGATGGSSSSSSSSTRGAHSPLGSSLLSAASTPNASPGWDAAASPSFSDWLLGHDKGGCTGARSKPQRPSAPNQTWVSANPGAWIPQCDVKGGDLSQDMQQLDLGGKSSSSSFSSSSSLGGAGRPFPKDSPLLVVCTRTVAELGVSKWNEYRQHIFLSSVASLAGVPHSNVRLLMPREKTGRRLLTVDLVVTFHVMAVSLPISRTLPLFLGSFSLSFAYPLTHPDSFSP
jgi:hypothetical protein